MVMAAVLAERMPAVIAVLLSLVPPLPKVTGMRLPAVMAVRPSQVTVIPTRKPADKAVRPLIVVSVSPMRPLLWVGPPSAPRLAGRRLYKARRQLNVRGLLAVRGGHRGHHMYMYIAPQTEPTRAIVLR